MCNHENREAAMVRIEGTPVPGVTTKPGYCDPCLHPLVQALNDGGRYTFASCCGHGHRPGWIALADGTWLVVATEEQRHVIDAAFPVDINGRVWDQTDDRLAERIKAICDQVEANPIGWGGAPAVSLARTIRNLLPDPERDPWLSEMSSSTGAWLAAPDQPDTTASECAEACTCDYSTVPITVDADCPIAGNQEER